MGGFVRVYCTEFDFSSSFTALKGQGEGMTVCVYCTFQNSASATTCQNCGASLSSAPLQALGTGSSLQGGKYLISKHLAQGGFGITYVAQHVALGQTVTIKELCPVNAMRVGSTLQPPTTQAGTWRQAVSGFVQEARTLAGFAHSGIVKVQDVFEENNTAYFVMEYLQGQTLADKLRTSVFTEAQTATLAQQICAALREVHAKGMLHRDLKPDNIFLENQRGAVLIDFGSARAFTGQTVQHTQMVTPGYAPLEQYSGSARVGPYTDIYALGATLYTALTGQLPPDAYARANGVALQFPNHVSATWKQLIDQAMRFKVDERPQTVDAFLAQLPRVGAPVVLPLPTNPVPVVNLPPTQQLAPTPPAKRSGFPMALLLLPLVAGGGLFLYGQLPRTNTPSQSTNTSSQISTNPSSWQASQIEIATEALNVRSAPDLNASFVESGGVSIKAVRGERLTVLEEQKSWYRVQIQNTQGWVSSRMSIPIAPMLDNSKVNELRQAVQNQDTVQLEAGIYNLDQILALTKGVEIVGQGWQKTILVSSSRTATLTFDSAGVLKLRNLTVAHSGAAPASAMLILRGGFEISQVRFMGGADSSDPSGPEGDGLVLSGNASGLIFESSFVGNRWRGLSIKDSAQVNVTNSVFRANSGSGVVANNNSQPEIRNNMIDGNGLMGFKAFDNAQVELLENIIEGNAKGAFGFYDSSSGKVISNTCRKNGGTGIEQDPATRVDFGANTGCTRTAPVQAIKTTPAPTFSGTNLGGVEFSAPNDRQSFLAFNRDNNLWNIRRDRAKSVNFSSEVGEVVHQATARAGQIYSWGMRWCGKSSSIVQNDLNRLELRLEANGQPIPASQVFSGSEPSANGGSQYCFRISTLIRGSTGSSVRLSVVANVLQFGIDNDGKGAFEVGEHRMTIDTIFD
jgi:serine/threonine protein kinase